jgi:hypothetical protein
MSLHFDLIEQIFTTVSLQHYANSICQGQHFNATAAYYTQHSNGGSPFYSVICMYTDKLPVVQLGSWQSAGIKSALSKNEKVIMSEFNSISCGGVAGISNTFAVGSMWTVDYALQLASVGYTAAHIHTREPGISYNLVTPSDDPPSPSSRWTTNPPFYGVLVTAEALRSNNGAIVVDLNLGGTSKTAAYGGYAVYDAGDKIVQQLVLFNYANVSISDKQKITFNVPEATFSSTTRDNLVVKYLGSESMSETTNIAWGGMTFANVTDGNLIRSAAAWAPASIHVDCSKGCNIDVPGPGLAIVFAGGSKTSASSQSCNVSPIVLAIFAIWTYLIQ